MNYPDYWPQQGWSRGWGEHGPEGELDLVDANQEVGNVLQDVGVPVGNYASAKLSRASEVGKAVSAYIAKNLVDKTYSSQRREATRMNMAAWVRDQGMSQGRPDWVASGAYRMREGQRGGPKPPSSGAIQIRKIKILRSPELWREYAAMKQMMRDELQPGADRAALETIRFTSRHHAPALGTLPVLDGAVGEVLLFHGTDKGTMKAIAKSGFDPNFCKNKGTAEKPNYGALGRGVYFSDSFAKVMTYTLCRQCRAYQCGCTSHGDHLSKRVTFLSRVLLGAPKNVRAVGQAGRSDIRQHDLDSLPDGRHSVYARGAKLGDLKFVSGSNEFVVKDIRQSYPEFVVYWCHAQA